MLRHSIYADYRGFCISTVELKKEKYYLHEEISVFQQVSNKIIQARLNKLIIPTQIVVNNLPDLISFLRKNNTCPIITKTIDLETIESKLYSIKSLLIDGELIINQRLITPLEEDFDKFQPEIVNYRIYSLIIALDNFRHLEPDEALTGHFKWGVWHRTS
ncbi:MAG: hypothetical protein F6K28_08145 [Microcoleus sp. SIO2G3]|nr:hypothetical protein [Microcoleus sp. SIO2G3]